MDQRPLPEVEDDRVESLRPAAPALEVTAVRPRHRLSRGVVAALAVGVLAFVAGLAIASAPGDASARGERPVRSPAAASPAASSPAASGIAGADSTAGLPATGVAIANGPGVGPGPDGSPAPTLPPPGSSAFLAAFDPVGLLAAVPGGEACSTGGAQVKEVPRTRMDGPRLTYQRSWMVWCPVPGAGRQAFLLDLLEAVVSEVPADTFGYSATRSGQGDALIPYSERPLAGTVAITADAAGDGYAIAIVVEEWRLDASR